MWLGGLFLVAGFGLTDVLPFPIFVCLVLIVLSEITSNGFYKNRKLALVIATFCNEIGHHACRLLPTVVRILKFRAADVCAKYREKHRNHGFVHVF